MKVAVAHWEGRISPVFDVSDRVLLIDVENGREVRRETMVLTRRAPFHRAGELAERGVEVLLCGALSLTQEKALVGMGVRVIAFLGGDIETVIDGFLNGNLSDGRLRYDRRTLRRPGAASAKARRPPGHLSGARR